LQVDMQVQPMTRPCRT